MAEPKFTDQDMTFLRKVIDACEGDTDEHHATIENWTATIDVTATEDGYRVTCSDMELNLSASETGTNMRQTIKSAIAKYRKKADAINDILNELDDIEMTMDDAEEEEADDE